MCHDYISQSRLIPVYHLLGILSRFIKPATSSPDFNFHPICEPLGFTHLAYVDDLLLLSRGVVGSVGFGNTAGLRANTMKSNIFLVGVFDAVKNELLQMTGFQLGSFPFRYLGIPVASTRLKISDFCPMLDKLSSKVNAWPCHSLSHAGRLELVRAVLQGVQRWMSLLPVPDGVIKKIYGICRNFFWSSINIRMSRERKFAGRLKVVGTSRS